MHGLGEGPKYLPAQLPAPRSQVAVHQLLEDLRVGYERLRLLGRHAENPGARLLVGDGPRLRRRWERWRQ